MQANEAIVRYWAIHLKLESVAQSYLGWGDGGRGVSKDRRNQAFFRDVVECFVFDAESECFAGSSVCRRLEGTTES